MSDQDTTKPMKAGDARLKFFQAAEKVKQVPFTFNGVDMEFIQPTVGALMNRQNAEGDERSFLIRTLIENTVLPGTKERIFEDSDYDSLMEMPANGEFQTVMKILTNAMDLNVDDKVKN